MIEIFSADPTCARWLRAMAQIVALAPPATRDVMKRAWPDLNDDTAWVPVSDLDPEHRPIVDILVDVGQAVRAEREDASGCVRDCLGLTGAGWIAAWGAASAWAQWIKEADRADPS